MLSTCLFLEESNDKQPIVILFCTAGVSWLCVFYACDLILCCRLTAVTPVLLRNVVQNK